MRRSGGMGGSVVVLDNGAGFCKAGMAGQEEPTAVVPNCIARPRSMKKWLVADQLQQCDDIQSIAIRRPMDRGYLVSSETQREIWDRIFKSLLKVNPADCGLLLVEPLFNLPSIQRATDELVFEDFGFQSLYVGTTPVLTHIYEAHQAPTSLLAHSKCSIVVDSGFSFTHAAPVFQNFVVNHAAKRINLGGKALTNYLKELVSYRAWNVMDETYIMEDVKEKLCFCSMDVAQDLATAQKRGKSNLIQCEYILPDGIKYKRGFVKGPDVATGRHKKAAKGEEDEEEEDDDVQIIGETKRTPKKGATTKQDEQELTLTNERFLVPEMLFHPADLGMNEAGLAECIVRAVSACHPSLHPLLYSSVVLTGGSTLLPGFKDRLELELRPLVPDEYDVQLQLVDRVNGHKATANNALRVHAIASCVRNGEKTISFLSGIIVVVSLEQHHGFRAKEGRRKAPEHR